MTQQNGFGEGAQIMNQGRLVSRSMLRVKVKDRVPLIDYETGPWHWIDAPKGRTKGEKWKTTS